MFFFPMSIPHIVLSSSQTLDGEISLHLLTPFGHLDISFASKPAEAVMFTAFDIRVETERRCWTPGGIFPPLFQDTIVDFVGRVALLHSGAPINRPYHVNVHLKNDFGEVNLSHRLGPYASASAGG